jgi:hypothetical protein
MNELILLAFGLAALTVIVALILILTGHRVPLELWQVTFTALGAGVGIAVPNRSTDPGPPPSHG